MSVVDPTGCYIAEDGSEQCGPPKPEQHDNGDGRGYNYWSDDSGQHWVWYNLSNGGYGNLFSSNDIKLHFDATVVNNNSDGSHTEINTFTGTDSNGVTVTVTSVASYDSSGQSIGEVTSIEFKKGDRGTVTIDIQTNTNFTYVRYEVKDKDGNTKDVGVVDSIALIGLRGWGTGLETGSTRLKVKAGETKDQYDDAIILANSEGNIAAFYNCNFESTNYTGKYSAKEKALTGEYGDIADGVYVFNYGYHKNYPAFWVNDNDAVKSKTYNPVNGNFTIKGCHIHKGGSEWSYSTGCITIYEKDWDSFMSYFQPNKPTWSTVRNELGETWRELNHENGNIVGTRDHEVAGILTINSI